MLFPNKFLKFSFYLTSKLKGGIKNENLLRVLHGVHTRDTKRYLDGVAVVSEIVSSQNPKESATSLKNIFNAFKEQEKNKESVSPLTVELILESVWSIIEQIPKHNPLIQQMANIVTANDQANATLALGASPVMAAYVNISKVFS